jgi:hypothetical protein
MRINGLLGDWTAVFVLFYFIVSAYAAVIVYRDAKQRQDPFLGLHPLSQPFPSNEAELGL